MTLTTPALHYRLGYRVAAILEDGSTNVRVAKLSARRHEDDAQAVGWLEWSRTTGEIIDVWVSVYERRQGVATSLYREAQERTNGFLHHSEWRTVDGQKWATSLGEELPKWRLA